MLKAWNSRVKSGFDLCDYIMTDGNAYIDTGFLPKTRVGFELEYSVSSFVKHIVFAGSSGSGLQDFDSLSCFWGSLFSDRRFVHNVGIGNKAFWDYSANGSNKYFDGNFHVIKVPYDSNTSDDLYTTTNILVDNVQFRTVSDTGSSGELPKRSLTVFAALLTTGIKIHQVPSTINLKLRRISFVDPSNVLVADFRAAKKDGKYGLGELLSNRFCAGIGGTIYGFDFS